MGRDYSQKELEARCRPVFEKIMSELGNQYGGWLVAIEPDSGDYLLGQDDYEILSRARKKHPDSVFLILRLDAGDQSVDSFC